MNLEDRITKKVGGVERSYSDIVLDKTKGREYLNSLYPNEFEYYALAFELLDENNRRIEFFSFPVLPQNIQENKNSITNIKKTYGGTVVMNSATFVPFNITITGNFGRKFRRVLTQSADESVGIGGTKEQEITGADGNKEIIKTQELSAVTVKPVFSTDYKTGYGSVKILENLILKAQGTGVDRVPYRLLMYNLSLNSNYMVEPINIAISQSRDQNMIWQYSLQLTAVAPAKYIFSDYKKSVKELRSYTKKYVRMTEQANIVNELLKSLITGMTPTEALMNQFQNYKAYGQQSAFKFLKQITDNPLETIDLMKGNRI